VQAEGDDQHAVIDSIVLTETFSVKENGIEGADPVEDHCSRIPKSIGKIHGRRII
jgi:hypothetical protein